MTMKPPLSSVMSPSMIRNRANVMGIDSGKIQIKIPARSAEAVRNELNRNKKKIMPKTIRYIPTK